VVVVIPLGILIHVSLGRRSGSLLRGAGWNATPAELEIATLVLREGLECVLVLVAVTAGLQGARRAYRSAIAVGVGTGFAATLLTWRVAARVLDDISKHSSALAVQAGTGLLAIVILLVVMNWFFHKLYWTGWISHHQQRKQALLHAAEGGQKMWSVCLGMASLGLTSFYREGFEVVLFLQSYRLRLGNAVVVHGVMMGMLVSGLVALLTFVAHRRLPYRRMLIATGLMLALVLLVMVGEEAQEMQIAGWLPATEIPWLAGIIPSWMDFWFSLVPTTESLGAQALAGLLVFGSYFAARHLSHQPNAGAP
jgi:high-affinity iron transporter